MASILEEIQKNYVENINSDALATACISALDQARTPDKLSVLGQVCFDEKILSKLIKEQRKLFGQLMIFKLEKEKLKFENALASTKEGGK